MADRRYRTCLESYLPDGHNTEAHPTGVVSGGAGPISQSKNKHHGFARPGLFRLVYCFPGLETCQVPVEALKVECKAVFLRVGRVFVATRHLEF